MSLALQLWMKQGGHDDFMWFGPLEHNTLRPWEILYCYVCVTLLKAEFNFKWSPRTSSKSVVVRSLCSTGSDSYMQIRGPTGGPGVANALLQQLGLYS
jgi:hypothetical protein